MEQTKNSTKQNCKRIENNIDTNNKIRLAEKN